MGLRKYVNGFMFMIHPEELKTPLEWRKLRMIFVNSMSDLFHEEMSDSFLADIFDVMEQADWHVHQILTKRPERMLEFTQRRGMVLDHIWMGVTVEEAASKKGFEPKSWWAGRSVSIPVRVQKPLAAPMRALKPPLSSLAHVSALVLASIQTSQPFQ